METGSESVDLLQDKLSRMNLMRAEVIKEAAEGIAGVNLIRGWNCSKNTRKSLEMPLVRQRSARSDLQKFEAMGLNDSTIFTQKPYLESPLEIEMRQNIC